MLFELLYLVTMIASLLVSIYLTGISWLRRDTPTGYWFTLTLVTATIIVASFLFFYVSEQPSTAFFWARLRITGLNLNTLPFLVFVFLYTEHEKWARPRYLLPLLIVSTITILLVWFKPEMVWESWSITIPHLLNRETAIFTGWYLLGSAPNFAGAVIACTLIVQYAMKSTHFSRGQAWSIISGVSIFLITLLLPLLGLTRGLLNSPPIGLTAMFIILSWALFRQGLLELSPLAYQTIIENMNDAVFVLDPTHKLVLINTSAQRLFLSHTAADVLGKPIETVLGDNTDALIPHTDKGQTDFEATVTINGQPRTFDVHISSIQNDAGQPDYKLCMMHNITDRKQAEAREFELALEQERHQLLSTFIQNAAHEFRTPLSIIDTNTYLLSRIKDPKKCQDKTEQIGLQTKRITRLVDMLLMMSGLESKKSLANAPVDVNAILESVCLDVGSMYENRPLLRHEIQSNLPPVLGDTHYLRDALWQILDNAFRFTPDDGIITVKAGAADDQVWIDVQDTGSGIAEDALPHIFETFWRQDTAHSTPGLGLGLPIAQKIIEGHGGQIEVESLNRQGTHFRVVLPVTQQLREK